MNKILLTCKKATELINKKQEHKISLIEEIQLAMHLKICYLCAAFEKQTRLLTEFLKSNSSTIGNKNSILRDSKKEELKELIKKSIS